MYLIVKYKIFFLLEQLDEVNKFFFSLKQLDEVMCKPNYPSIITIDQDS